jgi:hypothetical protein
MLARTAEITPVKINARIRPEPRGLRGERGSERGARNGSMVVAAGQRAEGF